VKLSFFHWVILSSALALGQDDLVGVGWISVLAQGNHHRVKQAQAAYQAATK
jgi:hypothetical protein